MTSKSNESERIARGAVVVFTGHAIALGLAFLTRVLAARLLSVSGYGYLILGVTVLNTCALIAQFGLREGLARNLPIADNQRASFISAIQSAVTLGIALASILILFSKPISATFLGPAFSPILVAFAIAVPGLVLINVTVGAFQGVEDAPAKAFIRNAVYRGFILLFVLGALLGGYGAVGAARAWALGVGLTAVVGIIVLSTRTSLLPPIPRWTRVDWSTTRSLVVFSFPLMIALSIWEVMHHADNLFIGYFLTGDSVAIYDAAFTLSKLLLIFLWALAFIFLPVFSGLYDDKKWNQMQLTYQKTTRWTILATLPLFLVMVSFADFILDLIFGPDYAAASYLMFILASAFMLHSMAGPNREALIAIGETRYILWTNLVALIANLVLNASLVPLIGVAGAAIATTSTYTLLNIALNYRLYTKWRISPVTRTVLMFIAVTTGLYFITFTMFTTAMELSLLTVLTFIVGFIILYGLLLISLPGGIQKNELRRGVALILRQ